ncbi:hypothetical protein JZ751_024399 [Albula glossodonta]|uniref:THD domain-containing protein n=1 Tax=Albula glossodonta TaxID=121402 RepID=A0A8T2NJ57_9TELE|nr:hypothetical protein JZ751_024399 [Albula glossodonta]
MGERRSKGVTSRRVFSSVGPFLLGATSLLTACTCLGLLLFQASQIHRMRQELSELKARFTAEETDVLRCGVPAPPSYDCSEAQDQDGVRRRRETTLRDGARKRQCQPGRDKPGLIFHIFTDSLSHNPQLSLSSLPAGRRSFLHLLPLSSNSYDEEDKTLLKWTQGQSQGDGLQLLGETVTVTTAGHYFIYSQVLYMESTYVMGHLIKKRVDGNETSLMKCIKSMPEKDEHALNSCYTAGVQYLESGSVLELSIPRKKAEVGLQHHATFMGLYRL